MYNHLCSVNIPEELQYLGSYVIPYFKYTQGKFHLKIKGTVWSSKFSETSAVFPFQLARY